MRRIFAAALIAILAVPGLTFAGRYSSSTKIYVQQNNWEKALQSIEKWKEEDPKSAEPYLWEGYVYTRKEEYLKAAEAFYKAYQKDPELFKDPKKLEKKLSITGQVLMNLDNMSIAILNGAIEAYNNKDIDSAIKYLEFLIKINPKYAQAYQILTSLYQIKAQQAPDDSTALEYLKKAREALETYHSLNPDDPRANYFLGKFYYDEAIFLASKGDTAAHREKLEKALEYLKKALDKGYEDANYDYGMALSDMGKNEEAIQYIKKAAEKNPDNFEVWFNLAIVAIKAGDKETALEALKKAVEIKPDDYTSNYLLSVLLTEKKEFQEALKYVDKALSIKETPEAYEQKAIILRELGKKAEALRAIEKAEKLKKSEK